MRTNPVIITNDLTRRFGDILAVDHLTLDVYTGEVLGLLGHNGAGKRLALARALLHKLLNFDISCK